MTTKREAALFGFSSESWKRATREGSSVLLGQLGVALVGLVGLRLITKLAEPAVFGEATLLLGAVVLGRNIFIAPVSNTQLRYHAEFAKRGALPGFTAAVVRLTWISTLLFGGVGLCAFMAWQLLHWRDFRPGLLAGLFLCVLAENARTLPINWLTAERQQGRMAIWSVADQILSLGASAAGLVIATRLAAPATDLYLAGQALGILAVALVCRRAWFQSHVGSREEASAYQAEVLRHARSYGVPFVALAIVGWVMNLGDRFILGGLMSTDAVGSYVASYSIASRAVMMPQAVLAGFARSVLFNAEASGNAIRARRIFHLWFLATLLAGGGVTLGLWLVGPWLAELLLDSRYRPGATALMVGVGAGHALLGVTQTVENRLMSLGISGSLIVPALIGGVSNIAFCSLLVPRLGAWGAALAKIGAFGAHCVVVSWALHRVQRGRAA